MKEKIYWVVGTKLVGDQKVTLMLCGRSVQKMKDELVRQGFKFKSAKSLTKARFGDLKTMF